MVENTADVVPTGWMKDDIMFGWLRRVGSNPDMLKKASAGHVRETKASELSQQPVCSAFLSNQHSGCRPEEDFYNPQNPGLKIAKGQCGGFSVARGVVSAGDFVPEGIVEALDADAGLGVELVLALVAAIESRDRSLGGSPAPSPTPSPVPGAASPPGE